MSKNKIIKLSSATNYSGKEILEMMALCDKLYGLLAEGNHSTNVIFAALLNIMTRVFYNYSLIAGKETALHDLERFYQDISEGLKVFNGEGAGDE